MERRCGGGDYKSILDTLKWEQQLLYPLVKHYEDKEQTLMKESFALIVLYASGIVTIFGIQKPSAITDLISAFPTNIMLLSISLGFCILSLTLIKYIAGTRCGCLLTMRQVNCIRQAIDALMYREIMNEMPASVDLLRSNLKNSTEYNKIYGQHRKLPIDNERLRDNYIFSRALRSPDNFLILILVGINCLVFLVPIYIAYVTPTTDDKLAGLLSGAALIGYLLLLLWVYHGTRQKILSALDVNRTHST